MAELLRCDRPDCGETLRRAAVVSWLRVDVIGLDVTAYGEPPLKGTFCSVACLIEYFSNLHPSRKGQAVA